MSDLLGLECMLCMGFEYCQNNQRNNRLHLLETVSVIKTSCQEDVAHDVQQLRSLLSHGLAADHEVS